MAAEPDRPDGRLLGGILAAGIAGTIALALTAAALEVGWRHRLGGPRPATIVTGPGQPPSGPFPRVDR